MTEAELLTPPGKYKEQQAQPNLKAADSSIMLLS
jgi:hypothetical protein